MKGATVEGSIEPLPADIYEGSLIVGNSIQDNIIPFPASYSGEFQLKMVLSDDARVVVVSGIGLSLDAENEFRFVEFFPHHVKI